MFYTLFNIGVILIGLALVYLALRLLSRGRWVRGFLRGLVGLALLTVAATVGVAALDLFSYKQIAREEPVATLSFSQLGPQHYKVTLVRSNGREAEYELRGDQWQLDARIIKWQGFVAGMGAAPAYRLDRIGGRYYSLSDERTAERTVHGLEEREWGPDIWAWINHNPDWVPLVDARYGSATFVPMADNALFEVSLSGTGLMARPLNEPARRAVQVWDQREES